MSFENFNGLSDLEMIRQIWSASPGNSNALSADRLLKLRASEREAETADKLVKSTDRLVGATSDLVSATKRLGTITIWLVGGTLLMGLAAVADVVLRVLRSN